MKKFIKMFVAFTIIVAFVTICVVNSQATEVSTKDCNQVQGRNYRLITHGYRTPDGQYFALNGDGTNYNGNINEDDKVLENWVKYMYNLDPVKYDFLIYWVKYGCVSPAFYVSCAKTEAKNNGTPMTIDELNALKDYIDTECVPKLNDLFNEYRDAEWVLQ